MRKTFILAVLLLASCQSGELSRWGGGPAKLPIPADCHQVISLGHSGTGGKYLCYRTKEGVVKMKEYSDVGIMEAEYVLSGNTFDENLIIRK